MTEETHAKIERRKKESELVVQLHSQNEEDIRKALETITSHPGLMAIENVEFYCQLIPHVLLLNNRGSIFNEGITYLKKVVENHGLSTNGQFDSHATRIMGLLASEKYGFLLKDPMVKESLSIVQTHYNEERHSKEYEKRLNYLHGLILETSKRM